MNELETLKQLLAQFIGAVQQSGIITPATGGQVVGGDFYALSIEALSKRVTILEAALSQAHDELEKYREDSFARNEVADLVREEMKKVSLDSLEGRLKEWLSKNTGVMKQQDLEETIANYLSMNDYVDSDTVDSKIEEMIDSHDFSTSPKLKRMVQEVVDEADLEDAVNNALESMTLNRYLDMGDLAADIEGELDIDSKVSDALDNIDLSDKLDIAPAVREHVDDALDSHDFSDALRNTLSDDAVVDALLKLLLERVNKTLMSEDKKAE